METLGLSESAARLKLEAEGWNELPSAGSRHFVVLLKEVLLEPMVSLLIGCGVIYIFLGDQQEAVLLLSFLFIILGITVYQERKTENALEALRSLSSPRALVIRDGQKKRIAGREVVRGDLLILSEGDRVAADAMLLSATSLMADESILTGESLPVDKMPGQSVYAGTTILRGQAMAQVVAIGTKTEMGRIGKILEAAQIRPTNLQIETRGLVRRLAGVAALLCVFVVIAYAWTRRDWLGGVLSGLTLAMAILPNELPAVLLIFLALGAWRISQRNVLTRKMPAVENLGAATVLCVDKTGTLTLNQMSVRALFVFKGKGAELDLGIQEFQELPEEFHELVEYGILASSPSPFDPMEKAVQKIGNTYLAETEHLHPDWQLTREYPLTSEMLSVSHVWKTTEQGALVVGAKGAPEVVADLCHLGPEEMARVSSKVKELGGRGLRILGVARAVPPPGELPGKQHDFDFEFLGILGLADPLRPGVAASIRECDQAGIRVIMITGDHAHTARNIAREIGLRAPDEVITGAELSKMDEGELSHRLKTVHCFARVVPEQKLRIVQGLQRNGEVVAMTGDGVNDAPALRCAQIGIAMGGRGTDVARESAALVLLDDDFSTLVEAIRTGRRIFDNLRSAMAYLLAIHVPIAGMSILPVALGLPLVLLPVHIAFLHLIIEPACSVVFEAEPAARDAMARPPRKRGEALFSKNLILPSLIQGLVVFGIVLGVFLISLERGQGEREARALTFTTLIFANLGLIFVNRSWSRSVVEGLRFPNKSLWWVTLGALVFLGIVLYLPAMRELFRFSVLHPIDLVVCLSAGLASIVWFETWKAIRRKNPPWLGSGV